MKNRVITGICYMAILVSMFALKIFVHAFFFDALIYAFTLIGVKEIVTAMKERITPSEKGIVYAFSAIVIPTCAIFEEFFGIGLHVTAILFFFFSVALLSLFVFRHDETTPESVGTAFFCAVYPAIMFVMLVLANHVVSDTLMGSLTAKHIAADNPISQYKFDSTIALLFIFFASAASDCMAFFTGSLLKKKFPKKLAPSVSPNKTVVGFIGGLLGGVLTGLVLYFVYNAIVGVGYANIQIWLPIYMAIGLASAGATAFGDLVESCIKRRLEIKDMGNLMPGHGGILDRLDGTMFAGVVVYLCFVLVHVVAAFI